MDGPSNVQMEVEKNLKQQPNILTITDLRIIKTYLDRAIASNCFFDSEKESVTEITNKLDRMIIFVQAAINEKKIEKNIVVNPPDNLSYNDFIMMKMFLEKGYRLNLYREEKKYEIDIVHSKLRSALISWVNEANKSN